MAYNPDELTRIAVKQLQTSEQFKQARMDEIRANEDMIAGKVQPALQGRYNVPFDGVIASGFVETLVAQDNKFPTVVLNDPKGSNHKGVRKLQSLFDLEKGPTKQKWAKKFRLAKRLAAASNIAIFEYYAESDPEYKGYLSNIDHYDFHCEPNGGSDLESHQFKGVYNQFYSKSRLQELGESGYFSKAQVNRLFANYADNDFKYNEDLHRNKVNRLSSMGLDVDSNAYVGDRVFNLARWVMRHQGEDYYLVFDYKSGTWLKCDPLKEVFKSGLSPWVVWQPVEHAFSLWTPGLFDQIKPVAEAIRINLNEVLNNNRKRNWDMKAVDSKMFPDISQLNWRQDGIVVANVPLNSSIQNGIYHFETPDLVGALNLNQYLNDFLGVNTGISDQTKGETSADTLGQSRINDIQISKRMKLIGDPFNEAVAELVHRWDWGVYEHIDEDHMVRVIGSDGVEMEAITHEDTEPDYDVEIITSTDEVQENEIELERKETALDRIFANPIIIQQFNPKWLAEQTVRMAGWKDEDIKRALDTSNDASDDIISEANKNIERALEGKPLKHCRAATTGYLQQIQNFLEDNDDMDEEARAALEAHFEEHLPIAAENKQRQMANVAAQNPMEQPEQPIDPAQDPLAPLQPGQEPVPPQFPDPNQPVV